VRPVAVLIFHAEAPPGSGPLVRFLAEARGRLAQVQRTAFLAAGADMATVIAGPPDDLSFGERLRAAVIGPASAEPGSVIPAGGLVVLGSGSIPLARPPDLRRFIDAAAGPAGQALANNRYSADAVAISRAADLAELPPLPADNALPRWLEEKAGVTVRDLRSHWRLGVDIDTPLDLLVLRGARSSRRGAAAAELRGSTDAAAELRGSAALVGERLAALAGVLTNRRAELLIAGRVSAATLRWLESGVACRVRALVEERGMRAASRLAQSGATGNTRPPHSILGELLDRDGPQSLAALVSRLGDAAIVDTRVLMAHRFGAEEATAAAPSPAQPGPEDRFASDLLLPAAIADPWLRSLTESAVASDRPLILGGHTMVNGGLRLLAQRALTAARR
jgi:hypothetical protein